MERKIGEIFTCDDKTYQVVKGITYVGCCILHDHCFSIRESLGPCADANRSDKTGIIFKEINNMEIKNNQLTIDIPEGMEIDLENSDLSKGIIKFKKNNITLEDIYENQGKDTFITNIVNNNTRTYNKISAIATLLDITNYYNKGWKPNFGNDKEDKYYIAYSKKFNKYDITLSVLYKDNFLYFKNQEDAQAVIDNPNFRDILDTIYKD